MGGALERDSSARAGASEAGGGYPRACRQRRKGPPKALHLSNRSLDMDSGNLKNPPDDRCQMTAAGAPSWERCPASAGTHRHRNLTWNGSQGRRCLCSPCTKRFYWLASTLHSLSVAPFDNCFCFLLTLMKLFSLKTFVRALSSCEGTCRVCVLGSRGAWRCRPRRFEKSATCVFQVTGSRLVVSMTMQATSTTTCMHHPFLFL
jgi:hypothetical protein